MELATLYVGVENLQDIARQAITATIAQWPTEFPKPNVLQLYVSADQTHLWNIWASHQFPSIKLCVKGVQRYGAVSKNLADMSLVLDAITDLLKGRTTHVAVLGDDSDYVVLFATINQEIARDDKNRLPFVWFLTDRPDTRSQALNDFLPSQYLHTIPCGEKNKSTTTNSKGKTVVGNHRVAAGAKEKTFVDNDQSEDGLIAKAIIRHIPAGPFKNADCMLVVKQHFSGHQLANEDGAKFGLYFTKHILPILKRHGVLVLKGRNPRKYEMTEDVKKSD